MSRPLGHFSFCVCVCRFLAKCTLSLVPTTLSESFTDEKSGYMTKISLSLVQMGTLVIVCIINQGGFWAR